MPPSPAPPNVATLPLRSHTDVAILGGGFAGICMAIRLKQQGHHNLMIFEKASSLGGTWRDNTYPGCGCDVPSDLYSLSFEQNPDWSRTFASQQEILDYLRRVAAKHQVEASVQFDTDIVALRWNETHQHWQLTAADGRQFTATVVISGMGGLHIPAVPELPGRDAFTGASFHTARWNHDIDLTGKRVAVIGTGASAVQIIPEIAGRVERLTVFQRTPPWVLPRNNRPTSAWSRWMKRYVPGLQWAQRLALYWKAEPIAIGFTLKPKMMGSSQKRAMQFLQSQVQDPVLRHQLTPQYSMGCKRVLLSDDYYAALTRPNVELVTRRVARLAPEGVVTGNGQRWPADVVIYATGFKPFNPTHQVEIIGREGRVLAADWADGPEAFKGVAVSGYPNFFMLMGPNSALGHNSILVMIEAQVRYISQCLRWLHQPGSRGGPLRAIEVRPEVQRRYNDWLRARFKRSVWHGEERPGLSPCTSWYQSSGGKNFTLWPSFATAYAWALRRPDPACFFSVATLPPACQDTPTRARPLHRAG
jgi:cation diffusion facilitator CzcD-associated flavoprotein CzcO